MASPITLLPRELLEHTLWFLPTRDILLASRVSRLWHQLISGSTKLQTALFRIPQPVEWCIRSTTSKWWAGPKNGKTKCTIRLVRATARDRKGEVSDSYMVRSRGCFEDERLPTGEVNDLFFDILEPDDIWESSGREDHVVAISINSGGLLKAIRSTDNSWRSMYVTQPPTKLLTFFWQHHYVADPDSPSLVLERDFRSEHGVTVGEIADAIVEWQDNSGGRFSLADSSDARVRGFVEELVWVSKQGEQQLWGQDDSSDDGAEFVDDKECEYTDRMIDISA